MGFFREIALPLIQRGIPVIPLKPKTKAAFLSSWEKLATTDPAQIQAWDAQYPEANAGSVAKAEIGGFWFLELDRPEAGQRIEAETGKRVPNTFRVRSSPGRGHLYWKQNAASLAMGNIAQNFVKYEDWSARVGDEYVVSPGSWHPTSGRQYEIASTSEIIEAPDWLIQWLISQKVDKKNQLTIEQGAPIPFGSRNSSLASIAGRLRQTGNMQEPELLAVLLRTNREQCQPPLDEGEVRTIAASIARYPVKDNTLLIRGVPAEVRAYETAAAQAETGDEVEPVIIEKVPYPKFPQWVMYGTSIYEGLVKPFCDVNSRYPEFMWMPAMTILLNYLGSKVHIKGKQFPFSFFLVLIGMKGQIIKSSSVNDAIRYFQIQGVADHAGLSTRSADGKSLVWSVGSPEGLGIEMQRSNCKNAILFYDELMTLVNKAGIDTSDLVSALLKIYESALFENLIKSKKESYSLAPQSYCASLIACTTDKNFGQLWSRLIGNESSGLKDRFFFLYQPQYLKPKKPYTDVNFGDGALRTRKLIDKALTKGVYEIASDCPLNDVAKRMENRQEIRVEKLALALAVDLDRDEVDEDCIERAIAIIDYERAAKEYLETFESQTMEAKIQMEIVGHLKKTDGVDLVRQLERALHPIERWGTFLWDRSYGGLLRTGRIRELGTGTKANPKQVQLLWQPEKDE